MCQRRKLFFYTHDINSGISGFNKINMESKDSINLKNLSEQWHNAINSYADTLNHDRKVEVIRLDDYVNSIDSDLNIDFLKIDTQGFEPEVFDGFGSKLSEDFSGNVYGNGHSKMYKEIVNYFQGNIDYPIFMDDTVA